MLLVVEADAGRLVKMAGLPRPERQRDSHQREQDRDGGEAQGVGRGTSHG